MRNRASESVSKANVTPVPSSGKYLVPVWHSVGDTSRKTRAMSVQLAKDHLDAKELRRSKVRKFHSLQISTPVSVEMSALRKKTMHGENLLKKEGNGHAKKSLLKTGSYRRSSIEDEKNIGLRPTTSDSQNIVLYLKPSSAAVQVIKEDIEIDEDGDCPFLFITPRERGSAALDSHRGSVTESRGSVYENLRGSVDSQRDSTIYVTPRDSVRDSISRLEPAIAVRDRTKKKVEEKGKNRERESKDRPSLERISVERSSRDRLSKERASRSFEL